MRNRSLPENQSSHSFAVSSIDFKKCYNVMDLRIAHGFSDRDLSFLLGYQPLFVRDIENPLHSKRYKPKDTNYLLHIFGCHISAVLDESLPSLSYKLKVVSTTHSNGTRNYQIYIEHPDKKYRLFRSFTELAKDEHLPPKGIAKAGEVKEYLEILLKGEYFKTARTGLELFRKCIEHFRGHIKPVFIQSAIASINKESKSNEIIVGKNDMRRFVYSVK